MIAVIDYGMGNLRSVQKALEKVGADARITQSPEDVVRADKVVLPGVGAMMPAMKRLDELNLIEAITEVTNAQRPFLGICLGYQLMFEKSHEGGEIPGLGLLSGDVIKFDKAPKIPQIGWNQINLEKKDCPLFKGIANNAAVYFCHSYYVRPKTELIATTTEYGEHFASSVCKGSMYGVQFHPEKSQEIGLTILKNFNEL